MRVQRYELPGKLSRNYRVALVSDLHDRNGDWVLLCLRALRPDLITIPGDLTDSIANKKAQVSAFLRACCDIAPCYVSLGNHEYNFTKADIPTITDSGAVLLRNEFVRHGELCIGGLTSCSYRLRFLKRRNTAAPQINWLNDFEAQEGYKLLLCHHPEYYEPYLQRRSIDLILAGHAHGGQLRFFDRGLYAPGQGIFPRYTRGVYDHKLVVSAGLCNSVRFLPRLGNPRELVIVDLIKGSRA